MKSVFPGWLVVAASLICMTVSAGIGWFVFPVFLKPIEIDMGWSRTALSGAVSLWAIVGGIAGPLIGILIDRYGPRRVMIVGTLLGAFVTVLISRMTALWHLYALLVLASLGSAASTYLPVTTTISYWFEKKRGTAMGIALLGTGVGGFVMPMLANFWLSRYGWRTAYFIFAFFLLALLVPIYFWMHHRPSDMGLLPDGELQETDPAGTTDPEPNSHVAAAPSVSPNESLRTRSFWGLGLGDFLIGICMTAVIVHMVAFATDSGISPTSATAAYGILQVIIAVGGLAFGVAADRINLRVMMVISYAVPAVAMPFLFNLHSLWPLYTFVFLFGITGGGRNALWPLAVGNCFGLGHFAAMMGWLGIPYMIGSAIGPPLAGYIYDTTKSYQWFFIICIGLAVCSSILISLMRDERKVDRA